MIIFDWKYEKRATGSDSGPLSVSDDDHDQVEVADVAAADDDDDIYLAVTWGALHQK